MRTVGFRGIVPAFLWSSKRELSSCDIDNTSRDSILEKDKETDLKVTHTLSKKRVPAVDDVDVDLSKEVKSKVSTNDTLLATSNKDLSKSDTAAENVVHNLGGLFASVSRLSERNNSATISNREETKRNCEDDILGESFETVSTKNKVETWLSCGSINPCSAGQSSAVEVSSSVGISSNVKGSVKCPEGRLESGFFKSPEDTPQDQDAAQLCPLCWKKLDKHQSNTGHLKSCAARHNVTTRQLLDALELQKRQAVEMRALGLPGVTVTKKSTAPRKEERERLITEKVAIILMGEEDSDINTSSGPAVTRSWQHCGDVASDLLRKWRDLDNTLWEMSRDCTPEVAREVYYVASLTSQISPCKVDPGAQLKHLSQIHGRLHTPGKHPRCKTPENTSKSLDKDCLSSELDLSPSNDRKESKASKKLKMTPQLISRNSSNTPENSRTLNLQETPKCSNNRSLRFKEKLPCINQTSSHFSETFTQDWRCILNKRPMSDVMIYVENKQEIPAHKLVFYVRCPAILYDLVKEDTDKGGVEILLWLEVPYNAAITFLEYLYCGTMDKILRLGEEVVALRHLAEKYQVDEVVEYIQVVIKVTTVKDFDVNCDIADTASQESRNSIDYLLSMMDKPTPPDHQRVPGEYMKQSVCSISPAGSVEEEDQIVKIQQHISSNKQNSLLKPDKKHETNFPELPQSRIAETKRKHSDTETTSKTGSPIKKICIETGKNEEKQTDPFLEDIPTFDLTQSSSDSEDYSLHLSQNYLTKKSNSLEKSADDFINSKDLNTQQIITSQNEIVQNNISTDKFLTIGQKNNGVDISKEFPQAEDEQSDKESVKSSVRSPEGYINNVWDGFDDLGEFPNISFHSSPVHNFSETNDKVKSPSLRSRGSLDIKTVNSTYCKSRSLMDTDSRNSKGHLNNLKISLPQNDNFSIKKDQHVSPSPVKILSQEKITQRKTSSSPGSGSSRASSGIGGMNDRSPLHRLKKTPFQSLSQPSVQKTPNEYDHLLEDSFVENLNSSDLWKAERGTLSLDGSPRVRDNITSPLDGAGSKCFTPEELIRRVTDKVTPLADYSAMKTPLLKVTTGISSFIKELFKYGLKPLKRKQAKQILRHIYNELHPWVPASGGKNATSPFKAPGPDTKVPRSPPKNRSKVGGPRRNTAPRSEFISEGDSGEHSLSDSEALPSSQNSRRDDIRGVVTQSMSLYQELPKKSKSKLTNIQSKVNILKDSFTLTQVTQDKPHTDSHLRTKDSCIYSLKSVEHILSAGVDFRSSVRRYITTNTDLYERILRYEPIWLEELTKELKSQGLKFNSNQLMDYLDEQCITFRTAQGQRNRAKKAARQKPRESKPSSRGRRKVKPS
ncbi:unnamed protein product [Timema podura]|uniref:Structure-specific endonuclease subunit SLX4 n=1 Tax=Timema podura TaxID=61482 RepID=A0ABN7NDV3_TIMPD|nr:unnamed protein product [Timema podura]